MKSGGCQAVGCYEKTRSSGGQEETILVRPGGYIKLESFSKPVEDCWPEVGHCQPIYLVVSLTPETSLALIQICGFFFINFGFSWLLVS